MVVSLQPRSTRILQPGMVSESQLAVLTTPEDMDYSSARSRPSSTYSLSVLRIAQTLIWLCYSWESPHYTAGLHPQVSSCRTDSWEPLSLPSSDLHSTVRQSEHHSSPGRTSASMMVTPRSYPGSYQSSWQGCKTLQPRSGPFQERFSRKLGPPIHIWLKKRCFKEKLDPYLGSGYARSTGSNQTAAAPMTPKQLISKIIQPAKTIEIPRTAAKPPSSQATGPEKLRVAAMSPSEPQPALPPPLPPPPPRIPSVSVSKPHPVIQENDRPHNPTESGDNNKAIPKVSVSKLPGPVQVPDKPQDTTKETTTLCRSNRVSKPNKRYADTCNVRNIASVVKNNPWLWSKKLHKGIIQMD